MTLHSALNFNAPAIFRGQEIDAHQEQYHLRTVQVLVNFTLPLIAGHYLPVMPSGDDPLPLKNLQVFYEFIAEILVLMGVRVKNLYGRGGRTTVLLFGHKSIEVLKNGGP